jgi:hypothetical protein
MYLEYSLVESDGALKRRLQLANTGVFVERMETWRDEAVGSIARRRRSADSHLSEVVRASNQSIEVVIQTDPDGNGLTARNDWSKFT